MARLSLGFHPSTSKAALGLLVLSLGSAAVAQEKSEPKDTDKPPATLAEALKQGELAVNLLYRYETVSETSKPEDAHVATLRSTLSYQSKPFHGVSFFTEVEDTTVVGNDQLHTNAGAGSLSNGVTDRPVVADPAHTEVNQAHVEIRFSDTEVRVGREEITLDNVRFVGNVGWRQNHQTFDVLSVANRSFKRTTLRYLFIENVNRIFGDNTPMTSHFVNGAFKLGAGDTLTAFGYFLDHDDTQDAGLSTATYGLRFHGVKGEGWKLHYDLEYAHQRDHGENPMDVDANYYRAVLGSSRGAFSPELGFEVLDGGDGGQFTTPLATLHAWNGWADQFLSTPAGGLEDAWLSLTAKAQNLRFTGTYHLYRSQTGNTQLGSELDFLLTYKSKWSQVFGLKAALYSADTHSVDTDKIWLWTQYSF